MKKPIIIIIGIVVILVIAGGAYALMRKNSGGDGTGLLSKVGLNANCKYNDADLCKFINSWKENQYYTVTSDSSVEGKKSTSLFKSVGDGKSQVIITTDGKETYNTISISDTTYVKDFTDGKWTKYVSKPDETLKEYESSYDFDKKAEQTEDNTTYKKIGTEACGNLTCFKYQVVDPDITDNIEYIYFDNKNYQLRKTRSEVNDGSVFEATFDYTAFTISEPSPIKETPSVSAPSGTSQTSSTESEVLRKEAEKALQNSSTQDATTAADEYSGE